MIRQLIRILDTRQSAQVKHLIWWLTAAAALQGAALAMAIPFFARLLSDTPASALPWLIALACACGLFAIVQASAQMIAFRVGSETARALHHLLGEHMARLPLGWFTRSRVGGLVEVATAGVPQLMSLPAILLRPLVTAVVTPAATAVAMLFFDWRLALSLAATGLMVQRVSVLASRRVRRVDAERHAAGDRAATRVVEYANAQQVLRAFGNDKRPHDLDAALESSAATARRAIAALTPGLVGFSFALQLAFAALLTLGALLVAGASLEPGLFIGLMIAVARLVSIAGTGAELGVAVRMSATQLERINEVLSTRPLPQRAGTDRPPSSAFVEFDDVTFGYGDSVVLDGVSFEMPERGMIALVGPSGSGKTTITRLLARFWDVDKGAIRLNGHDIRSLPQEQLLSNISIVFQDVYLFEGTIEDNVRLGRPGAPDAEVAAAMDLAGVTGLAADLPAGTATQVGTAGALLSGGQRQRISIARAVLKAAPITILDEATAALDPENAGIIQATLRTLAERGAVLVIAHHMSTVRAADTILVLDRGRVVDRGTHDELAARPGLYADYTNARHAAEGWSLSRT
jgi:ATP-binding cassette subfamily B protein